MVIPHAYTTPTRGIDIGYIAQGRLIGLYLKVGRTVRTLLLVS